MRGRERSTVLLAGLSALLILALSLAAASTGLSSPAESALERAGVEKGICVVLGLPEADQGEYAADLATGSELLIYFQSPDSDEVTRVRSTAEARGLLGKRLFAGRGGWKAIHLADNLADAVLVSPAAAGSVAEDELLRVLHPQGKVVFPGRQMVKPFPQGIDDWGYPYHGADNNPQSADEIARAPYLTQFIAEPKFGPSPAVTVAAGGRIFRAFGHLAHRENQNAMLNTLLAVNAYNGTILWKRPLSRGFMILRNTIVATPETLYLADDESCKLLDAATGELIDEIVPPHADVDGKVWKWMALEGGVLYGLTGGEEFKAPVLTSESFGIGGWPRANWPGFDYQDPKTAWAQGRTLLAIDVKAKKLLWRRRQQDFVDGRAVCMRGGRIYFYSPQKSLACLDADSGQVVWKTSDANLLNAIGPLFSKLPRWTGLSPFPYLRCNDKSLFFSGPRMPRVVVVRTEDGKLAWQKEVPLDDGGSVHLVLRRDALYAVGAGGGDGSFSMEYETGKVLTRFLGRRGCTIATGSADSIFYRAPGGTVRVDLATGSAEHIAPMRPPCYEGVVISGGMLYWGAWKCRCQLSLYGHVCLAPAGDFDFRPGADQSRLELGPRDTTTIEKFEVHGDDWPCYQGDNSRTSATAVRLPQEASRKWSFPSSSEVMPTAPVAVGGLVFVADESGVVRALDASSGRPRWKAYTGGAVFFPPAVWEGRVYVGSADGCVYAFEATTGRRLWRFRAAPAQRRIPVFGKLISTWPVAGGVVVQNGVVYAAAGIAHYDGTHVYALDAVTGKVNWYNDSSGRLSEETNSGVSLQGSLYVDRGQLCFSGGNVYPTARYDLRTGQSAIPAQDRVGSGFRTAFYPYYPRHGRYVSLNHRLADGRLLNCAADYSGALYSTLALFGPLPPGAAEPGPHWRILPRREEPKGRPPILWEQKSPQRFNGFVVAPETLLAAGEIDSGPKPGAFLTALRIEDGTPFWREQLPAPVVKGGMAVDRKARIVVSLEDGRVLCFASQ